MPGTRRLDGKAVLVMGGAGGIGRAASSALARLGASVTIVGRDEARCAHAAAGIRSAVPGADIGHIVADLGTMRAVRALAGACRARCGGLHALVHAAGVIEMRRTLTPDGLEANFAVNYLARFLATDLLDDLLGPGSRVVALATPGVQPVRFDFEAVHRAGGLSGFRAYQQSQAANDVWGAALADRLRPRGVHVAVVSPGIVRTSIRASAGAPWWLRLFDKVVTPFASAPEAGAETVVRLASDAEWPEGGPLFGPKVRRIAPRKGTCDPAIRAALEQASLGLVHAAGRDGLGRGAA